MFYKAYHISLEMLYSIYLYFIYSLKITLSIDKRGINLFIHFKVLETNDDKLLL
jgi:hypothetical protein